MTPIYCSKGHENPANGRFCLQCGEKLELSVAKGIYPGLILGARYHVVRELGHGGFGRTYLAEDLNRFNEPCVLKEFAPQVQGTYALQKAEELFSREAGVLYKLQHAQIPKFREMFRVKQKDKGFLFLVQDFVEGQTYHALLDARKRQGLRFSEAEVTQLMLQLLPVLEYIHSLGVIHRDISPDNLILRSADGLPVLIDFGGVKQVAATVASQFMAVQGAGGIPAMPTLLGKVGYAPHEQMQGGIVYPHSDLYALAATVLVLLTGREPQQLIDPDTLMWNWRREVNLSPMLGSVLDRMLQPYAAVRYQSAGEVLQALSSQPAPAASPQQPLPTNQDTLAIAPSAVPEAIASAAEIPLPNSTGNRASGWLGKILLVFGVIVVAGGVGWLAGNLWLHSQFLSQATKPQSKTNNSGVPASTPETEQSPPFSPEEIRRKEALQQRRTALDIRYSFYANLVNEEFWTQYPQARGQTLGTGPEDATARAEWDAIASDLLKQLDRADLSEAARRQLGSFKNADIERAKAEANQRHLSSRAVYDLADAKFFQAFPQQQGKSFRNKPIGQVWQAFVFETLNEVKTGSALKPITFDLGATHKKVTGTINPRAGRVFTASLSSGQMMTVKLATAENALFSIYSPSGKTTLLQDSRDRTWSGSLPQSGVYEFVVVSEAAEPISYQLDITVDNGNLPTPELSPVDLSKPTE